MKNSNTTFANPWNEPALAEGTTARTLIKVIASYQRLTAGRVSACRFYPSCSSYAVEAIHEHGAWRGSALALRRLSRCRPFGPHGVDLVPHSPQARRIPR
jgi:uncharacterized protein